MNENLDQDGRETEGVPTPPVGEPLPQAELPGPMLIDELAQSGTGGTAMFAAVESAAADQAASASGTNASLQAPAGDGLPGGDLPASSGFSWRLPGSAPVVIHSQGGIPNEFDHLFRDSDHDNRRSLLPSQGPIGVVMPGGHAPGPGSQQSAFPSASEATGFDLGTGTGLSAGESALPTYHGSTPPSEQPASQPSTSGYPPQPYDSTQYQQASYQPTMQAPAGASAPEDGDTQTIPRVPAQAYAYGSAGGPQYPATSGVAAEPVGPRGSSAKPLLIAGGLFVVLIVIAAVAFLGGNKKNDAAKKGGGVADTPSASVSSGSSAAKLQADAIYAVVLQGKGLREKANGAITDIQGCKNQAAAVATFTDIAKVRNDQADAVAALKIDQLPAGAQELVQTLHDGWQRSADAENDYVKWAQDNAACVGKSNTTDGWNAAVADGGKAGSLKVKAANQWNALLVAVGEQQIDQSAL